MVRPHDSLLVASLMHPPVQSDSSVPCPSPFMFLIHGTTFSITLLQNPQCRLSILKCFSLRDIQSSDHVECQHISPSWSKVFFLRHFSPKAPTASLVIAKKSIIPSISSLRCDCYFDLFIIAIRAIACSFLEYNAFLIVHFSEKDIYDWESYVFASTEA